jgi:hypothetical protein
MFPLLSYSDNPEKFPFFSFMAELNLVGLLVSRFRNGLRLSTEFEIEDVILLTLLSIKCPFLRFPKYGRLESGINNGVEQCNFYSSYGVEKCLLIDLVKIEGNEGFIGFFISSSSLYFKIKILDNQENFRLT